MKTLVLPIKKKWFDMIESGEKKEEYRDIKPYYSKRFKDFLVKKPFDYVEFRNGYGENVSKIIVELADIRFG